MKFKNILWIGKCSGDGRPFDGFCAGMHAVNASVYVQKCGFEQCHRYTSNGSTIPIYFSLSLTEFTLFGTFHLSVFISSSFFRFLFMSSLFVRNSSK